MPYDKPAPKETVAKVIAALKERNIEAEAVATKADALKRLQELIPDGADVMTGSSTTLNEIGFTELLKSGAHKWKNRKDAIASETDPKKQTVLRHEAIFADHFLGSIHAITEDGEILVASASGSQLPSYVYTSPNITWVVGTQKIVPNLTAALARLREYVFPLEDARMKSVNMGGSVIAKILLFEREPAFMNRKVRLIFVEEKLGF